MDIRIRLQVTFFLYNPFIISILVNTITTNNNPTFSNIALDVWDGYGFITYNTNPFYLYSINLNNKISQMYSEIIYY